MNQAINPGEKVVLAFIDALNREDFETAKNLVNENLVFKGVMGERNGAESYFEDMQKMKFKYTVQETFTADSDNICLAYEIDMGQGKFIFSFGWYKLRNGKIDHLRVVFDPRPLLDK